MTIKTLSLMKNKATVKAVSDNIYYNFAVAVFKEIALADDSIDACLPEDWRPYRPVVAVGDETGPAVFLQMSSLARKTSVRGAEEALAGLRSVMDPIRKYAGPVINAACGGKAALQSFIIGIVADQLKSVVPIPPELQALLFVEKSHKTKWGFSIPAINIPNPVDLARKAAEEAAANAKRIADEAAATAKRAAEEAAKQAEIIAKKALEAVMSAFKPVAEKIPEILSKITAFINSPVVVGILKIMNCLLKGIQAIREVINVIKGFKAKLQLIPTGPPGLVNIGIALICNIDEFLGAIDFIIKSQSAKNDVEKWQYIGRFFGKFIHALGTA
jgi:hypothetical protein